MISPVYSISRVPLAIGSVAKTPRPWMRELRTSKGRLRRPSLGAGVDVVAVAMAADRSYEGAVNEGESDGQEILAGAGPPCDSIARNDLRRSCPDCLSVSGFAPAVPE